MFPASQSLNKANGLTANRWVFPRKAVAGTAFGRGKGGPARRPGRLREQHAGSFDTIDQDAAVRAVDVGRNQG